MCLSRLALVQVNPASYLLPPKQNTDILSSLVIKLLHHRDLMVAWNKIFLTFSISAIFPSLLHSMCRHILLANWILCSFKCPCLLQWFWWGFLVCFISFIWTPHFTIVWPSMFYKYNIATITHHQKKSTSLHSFSRSPLILTVNQTFWSIIFIKQNVCIARL